MSTSSAMLPHLYPPPTKLLKRRAAGPVATGARRGLLIGLAVAGLVVGAFGLRLAKLGSWSFWCDEFTTFYDGRMILSQAYWNPGPYNPPHEVFIHASPIGYVLLGWWHAFSGYSEFWARLPLAVASAGSVILGVLLIWRFRGPWVAIALAFMLVGWPWHLFHAQLHRVYSFAYLFGLVGYLLADAGFARPRGWLVALAGVVLSLAGLTHNVAAVMLGMVIGWQALLVIFDRSRWPIRSLVWLTPAVLGLAVNCVLFARFTKGYEAGSTWQISSVRCVLSLVFNLSLPVTLAAVAGAVWALWNRRRDLYWNVAAAGGVGLAVLVVPAVTVFRADYVFAITAPFHVLAAAGLGEAAGRLWPARRSLSLAIVTLVPLLMMPSIVSHYIDGDRPDYRAAAQWLRPRLQPGDVVWSNQAITMNYYLDTPTADPLPRLPAQAADAVLERGGRVWVVDNYSTGGIAPEKLVWLSQRFRLQTTVQRTRLDYHQNGVAIHLADR